MKFQVAKVYRYGRFMGYGIAVDGNLLDGQVSTTVDTDAKGIPLITAVFNMKNEHAENQITICLDDEGDSQKVDLIKKAVAESAARNYRAVVNSVSRGE
ncbi:MULTISPECIES: hypothetical protein [Klebsiella pneumoniae complex]|uniref:hypothetical protein n=1 Tax=Klebsiella pneumoniae complex TaxID=3390273 RepID=UPI000E08DB35|nr:MULTISPECIES: hypothetical protein [Klebsiella]KAB7974409.1 hypothetical protein GCK80_25140 [Klebsiella pneumoniae]KAB7977684.1 hypothetical protein GCK90_22130 [Klebsiella pneumoniae]KAB7988324.1 hypothetical protein GCK94_14425 [Klebsiella pneumoniae]KAB7994416.1 hypothetical protein GCK96_25680 [Klebsiella pneumoniae]MCY3452884.1 hypothetical protein [Klebsiella pneumoniae]